LLAQIAGEKQSSVPLSSPVQKRRADGDLQRTTDKLVRRDQPVANSTTTMTQIKKPASSLPAVANPSPTVAASSNAKVNPPTSNGTSAVTGSAAEPAKLPKKGSYAETLARAKAAQATLGKVGRIQHKAIEKGLSKRERQELKERGSQSHRVSKRTLQSGVRTHARDGRNGVRGKNGKISSKVKVSAPEKKIKKAALATTGYTGTARPNPTTVKSSKSTTPSRANEKSGYGRSSSGRRETYASEDEDEEDEEGEDYGSEISSDMEADVFEVDEEEERAARIARKEDEEALREEARHQREKEEKRRRLAAMAKSRR